MSERRVWLYFVLLFVVVLVPFTFLILSTDEEAEEKEVTGEYIDYHICKRVLGDQRYDKELDLVFTINGMNTCETLQFIESKND